MSKVTQKQEKRSKLILDIAERHIVEKGLSGLNARDIANEAGCAVGSLYPLFGNLDGIIIGVNSRTLHRLDEALSETAQATASAEPLDRLVAMANTYLDFVLENRKTWTAVFEHVLPGGVRIPDWHLEEHYSLFQHIIPPLSELTRGKSDEELAMLARTIYSAVHGIISLGLQDRMSVVPTDILRKQVETIVSSFAVGYQELEREDALAP